MSEDSVNGDQIMEYRHEAGVHYFTMFEASLRSVEAYSRKMGDILEQIESGKLPRPNRLKIFFDNTRCGIPPLRHTYDQMHERRKANQQGIPVKAAYLVKDSFSLKMLTELGQNAASVETVGTVRRYFLPAQRDEAMHWLLAGE